jgi:hypothetical protein
MFYGLRVKEEEDDEDDDEDGGRAYAARKVSPSADAHVNNVRLQRSHSRRQAV